MYTSRIFLLLSCSFSVSMSIVRTAELDLNPPSTGEAGAQMNQASCPSPINNGTKPFWFVPATASPEAQQFLSTTSPRSVLGEGPMDMLNMSTVAALRQFFQEYSAASKAAEQALLQSTHNDTIAGVPVVFAQPITVTASDSSRGSKARDQLLIYLHGGGRCGSCMQPAANSILLLQHYLLWKPVTCTWSRSYSTEPLPWLDSMMIPSWQYNAMPQALCIYAMQCHAVQLGIQCHWTTGSDKH